MTCRYCGCATHRRMCRQCELEHKDDISMSNPIGDLDDDEDDQ